MLCCKEKANCDRCGRPALYKHQIWRISIFFFSNGHVLPSCWLSVEEEAAARQPQALTVLAAFVYYDDRCRLGRIVITHLAYAYESSPLSHSALPTQPPFITSTIASGLLIVSSKHQQFIFSTVTVRTSFPRRSHEGRTLRRRYHAAWRRQCWHP